MSAVSDERKEAEQHPPQGQEMRTEELMREYEKHESRSCPNGGWECLVWHASSLIRSAKRLRNTLVNKSVKSIDERFVQDELF